MTMDPQDFKFLSDAVKNYSGIAMAADKEYLFESRLMPIAKEKGLGDLAGLVKYIKENKDEAFFVKIIEAMTTNESFFFRDTKPFTCLCKNILPALLQKEPDKKHIRIWSAACSTGQEPYSIAMSLMEEPKMAGITFEIIATDLDQSVLQKAKDGVYSQFEVQRGMPINLLIKYFAQEGENWRIKDTAKTNIKFTPFNLLDNSAAFGTLDIIFCRNVLIYFDLPTKEKVIKSLCERMGKRSFLVLGATEGIMGMENRLGNFKNPDGSIHPGVFCFVD